MKSILSLDGDERPVNGGPDMGADEINTCHLRVGGEVFHVLQEAIDYAETNGINYIEVGRGICSGVAPNGPNDSLQIGYISQNIEFKGSLLPDDFSDPNDLHSGPIWEISSQFDARGEGRALYIAPGANVTFTHIAFVNGDAYAAQDVNNNGGAVYLDEGAQLGLYETHTCQSVGENGGGFYAATNSYSDISGLNNGFCAVFLNFNDRGDPVYAFFDGNTAVNGGGAYFDGTSDFEFRNHGFDLNTASDDGGGLYVTNNGRLINGVFVGNIATTGNGGGVYTANTLEMYHNSLRNNVAGGSGGGIHNAGSSLTVNSSIFYTNTAAFGGGGIDGPANTSYNLYYENVPVDATGGTGPNAIFEDPQFAFDVILNVTSPAIDQADPALLTEGNDPYVDYDAGDYTRPDGDPNHQHPDGKAADIGADEWFKDFGCLITPDTAQKTGVANETTTYNLNIINEGYPKRPSPYHHYYTDTLSVTIKSSTEGWSSLVGGDPRLFIDIGPHVSEPVSVTVDVPNVLTGQDVTIIECVSQARPDRAATASLTTIVGVDKSVRIEYPQNATLEPGEMITFSHIITNTGNLADSYELIPKPGTEGQTLASIVDEFGTEQNGITFTLAPGEEITHMLRIQVLDTGAATIVDTPGATVQSLSAPAAFDSVLNNITISYTQGTRYVAESIGSDNTNCTNLNIPCATIQWAVDQAVDGDAILVAAGLYTDTVTHTVSANTYTQTLFVDKSVSIIGGYSTADGFSSQETITNAVMLDGEGGQRVVYVESGHDVVLGGLFIQNGATLGDSIVNGGGVYNTGSNLTISSTLLLTNSAELGGGVYHVGGDLTLHSVAAAGNGVSGAGGGAIYAENGAVLLENNSFVSNSASAGSGGAAYVAAGSLTVLNTIFAENTAVSDSAFHAEAGVTVNHNEFNLYHSNTPVAPTGVNDLVADPQFSDNYYHIGSLSPALDAGTFNNLSYLDGTDIDGEPRKQGNGIDIGADEFTQRPEFTLLPTPLELTIAEGATAVFTHTLTNNAPFADGYTFSITYTDNLPGGSWSAPVLTTNPADTTAIPSGGTVAVTLTVAGGLQGHQREVAITAASTTDTDITKTATDLTIIAQDTPGVAIGVSETAVGQPGDTIVYTHILTNTGSGANRYDLSQTAAVPTNWSANVTPLDTGWLEAGATMPFTVTVGIASTANDSDSFTAVIRAESISDAAINDELMDVTTVSISGSLTISPTALSMTIDPGATAVYTHTVTNLGGGTESVALSFNETPTGWVSALSPAAVTLSAGESKEVYLTVIAPIDAANATHTAVVTARALSTNQEVTAVDTTITETPTGIALYPPSDTRLTPINTTVLYTHTLKNWDTVTATVDLTYTEQSVLPFGVVFTPTTVVLGADETTIVAAAVTAPGNIGLVHELTIHAESSVNGAQATAVDTTVTGFNIDLTTNPLRIVDPGTTVTYTHTFTNVDGVGANFNVNAVSSRGWLSSVTPSSVSALGAGQSVEITVVVDVPAGAAPGIDDYTELTVAWQDNDILYRSATDRTRTTQTHSLSWSQNLTQTVAAGTDVVYNHILRNSGNGPDTFMLSATSSQGWAMQYPATVDVLDGGLASVAVTLTVPAGTQLNTVDTMQITAVSIYAATPSAAVVDTTIVSDTITPPTDTTLYLPLIRKDDAPPPPTGLSISPTTRALTVLEGTTAVYGHRITNNGANSETVTVAPTGNGWNTTVDPSVFSLAPGGFRDITVSVAVPNGTAGQTDTATIQVNGSSGATATAVDTTTSVGSGTVTPTPVTPTPVTPTPVTPTPITPTPATCVFVPPAAGNPAGIDLIITGISVSPANPAAGEQTLVGVTIKNQGQTSIAYGNNFFLDLYLNPVPEPPILYQIGNEAWGVQGEDLSAGASKTYYTTFNGFPAGSHRLWAQVDTDNNVNEANESNNLYGCQALPVSDSDADGTYDIPAPPSDRNAPRATPTPSASIFIPVEVTPFAAPLRTATPMPAE